VVTYSVMVMMYFLEARDGLEGAGGTQGKLLVKYRFFEDVR
jgi:hypothetical protein